MDASNVSSVNTMTTSSNILIQQTDGTILSIYCHTDGYFEGAGQMLFETPFWQDVDNVNALIEGGNILSLGEDLATTVFYTRDRGEPAEDTKAIKVASFTNAIYYTYTYMFKEDETKWVMIG